MTIRRTPHDFRVEERPTPSLLTSLAPAPSPASPHAVFRLAKNSLTTPQAEQRLAKALNLNPNHIHHAGLKDKHAITSQLVSCHLSPASANTDPLNLPQLLPSTVPAESTLHAQGAWHAQLLGYAREPASAAWIDRNRFTITLRDLTPAHIDTIDRHLALLRADPSSLLFTNYFGDQRFGSARHKHGFAAAHLIRGEFEDALRLTIATPARKDTGAKRAFTRQLAQNWGNWTSLPATLPRGPEHAAVEALARGQSFQLAFAALPYFTQRLCVEAFQSYLWNKVAATLVETAAHAHPIDADRIIRARDDFALMLFPPASAIAPPDRSRQLPMPAPSTIVPPWAADAYALVLRGEHLTLDQLRIPGLRRPAFDAFDRPLFALATNVSMTTPERDELSKGGKRLKRSLQFDLPSGSYATVLLRALGQ
jgi:tRNA pseudouridine13 synthase